MANLTIPQIQSLLRQAGWREDMIAKWSAIVIYESNGNPNASNKKGEYSIGLLQMNMKAHGTKYGTEAQLQNPLWNLQQAWKLWNIQGDRAWLNSVNKYKNNFQGIAEKARQIYNQGGNGTTIIQPNQLPNVINNTKPPQNADNKSLYIALGIVAFVVTLKI